MWTLQSVRPKMGSHSVPANLAMYPVFTRSKAVEVSVSLALPFCVEKKTKTKTWASILCVDIIIIGDL